MTTLKVIVCEQTGDWSTQVRRHLPLGATMVEMRHWDQLWECLRESPQAVVAIELQRKRGGELLAALTRLDREFPHTMPIVLAQHDAEAWEDLCREAGAVAFIIGPRRIEKLTEIIRGRIVAQSQWADEANEEMLLEDRIFGHLPWAN